ncbi:PREDICTED: protein FAM210B [Ceratotherium simum simum]|uniref:Protein FAM210B n=1 Tax=Ceratotherium simum simum TaxID=73337 RepID=A0ABM1CU04_CERSS|nr:PREDICTED: protein FAM210B [Ceratotherium simum simum]
MAGLLVLLGPAGRAGARVRPRAAWLLSAAAPCSPPPLFLPLLRPGPDAPLVRAAGGDGRGRQRGSARVLRIGGLRVDHQGWGRWWLRGQNGHSGGLAECLPSLVCAQDPSRITGTAGSDVSRAEEKKQSKSQQLKKVFQEYGAVGVSLHIGISLISLGIFYMVVSSGVDMSAVLLQLGFKESLVQSKMAAGTGTFVVAYAIHKLFAPVRISITLVSVPFVVRYFRKVGFFKPPAAKP